MQFMFCFLSFRGFADSILECKECDSNLRVHPECLPVPVPQGDPFYPPINITTGRPFCLAFTRSMPGQLTLGEIVKSLILQLREVYERTLNHSESCLCIPILLTYFEFTVHLRTISHIITIRYSKSCT